MAGNRAGSQKLIPVPMKEEFIAAINHALKHNPETSNRSQFIRTAVKEKLVRMDFDVPPGADLAPGRAGNAASGQSRFLPHQPSALPLNEKAAKAAPAQPSSPEDQRSNAVVRIVESYGKEVAPGNPGTGKSKNSPRAL